MPIDRWWIPQAALWIMRDDGMRSGNVDSGIKNSKWIIQLPFEPSFSYPHLCLSSSSLTHKSRLDCERSRSSHNNSLPVTLFKPLILPSLGPIGASISSHETEIIKGVPGWHLDPSTWVVLRIFLWRSAREGGAVGWSPARRIDHVSSESSSSPCKEVCCNRV